MQRTPPLPSGSDVSTQKRELSTIPAWASSRLVASNCGNVFTSIVGPVTGKEPRAADDIQGRGNRQNVGRPQKSKASTSRPSLASTFHSRRHLKDGARRRCIVSTRSAKSSCAAAGIASACIGIVPIRMRSAPLRGRPRLTKQESDSLLRRS